MFPHTQNPTSINIKLPLVADSRRHLPQASLLCQVKNIRLHNMYVSKGRFDLQRKIFRFRLCAYVLSEHAASNLSRNSVEDSVKLPRGTENFSSWWALFSFSSIAALPSSWHYTAISGSREYSLSVKWFLNASYNANIEFNGFERKRCLKADACRCQ